MGVLYAKVSGAWVPILNSTAPVVDWTQGFPTYDPRYVNVAGDTMTGVLHLYGSDPTAADEAVPLGYLTSNFYNRSTSDGRFVNITGDVMTGPLSLSGDPTNPIHAAPKQYVDAQVATRLDQATADGLYVNVTGDDMTGRLGIAPTASGEALRLSHTNPSVQFWDTAGTPARQSLIQATATALNVTADGTRDIMFFAAGTNGAAVRAVTTGEVFSLGGNPDCLLGFRTTGATGATRNGFVGMSSSWIRLVAENGNNLILQCASAGELRLNAPGGGPITFFTGGSETMRVASNAILFNTTDAVVANNNAGGVFSLSNWLAITNVSGVGVPCFVANKTGGGLGSGSSFHEFRTSNNTIGSITRNLQQAAVLFNTTSDYRLKDDRGLITDALERLARLAPRRVVWKEDPTQMEVDGFFAHEVSAAVPEAVTGIKDDVADADDADRGLTEGQIIPQQLDLSKLVPLLVAAVQELDQKLNALAPAT